jgi:hypothetical protein
MKTLFIAASLALITLPLLQGAPRSKNVTPAVNPARAEFVGFPGGTCGRILIREPGRKTARMAPCSPAVCVRNARCFEACGH